MIQIDKPMPEGCDVCPLMYDYIQCNALPEGCEDDDDFNKDEFDWTKRPDWCPLKEIVQCKDCKYWEHTPQNTTSYWKPCDEIKTEPHYFCWCGKRRTD